MPLLFANPHSWKFKNNLEYHSSHSGRGCFPTAAAARSPWRWHCSRHRKQMYVRLQPAGATCGDADRSELQLTALKAIINTVVSVANVRPWNERSVSSVCSSQKYRCSSTARDVTTVAAEPEERSIPSTWPWWWGVFSSSANKQQQTSAIFSYICSPQSPACSLENPLSCAVGEISARQGTSSLTERRVYTDSSMDLSGDFTGNCFKWALGVKRMKSVGGNENTFPLLVQWFTGAWCWRTETASSPAPTSCQSVLQQSRPSLVWPSSAGEW